MTQMKDSGENWIGQIPNSWNKIKLKNLVLFEKGKNAALYTSEYIGMNQGEYPVYSGQTENDGIMGFINSYDYDLKKCLFTTTVGAKAMTPRILTGKFSLSQNCLIMLRKQMCDLNYIYYSINSLFDYEKSLIPSHMQPSLRIEDLKTYNIVLPSYQEQNNIAGYLDKKCEQIDKLIEIQEKEIDKLKEYRTSVITKAVTKGLDETVPMKDSGIDWIGSIPEHWQIRTMKSVGYCFGGLTYSPEDICDKEDGVLVLRSSNIKNGQLDFNDNVYVKYKNNIPLVKKDDILICSRNGSRDLIGKNAYIDKDYEYSFGAFMMIFRTFKEYSSLYVQKILSSNIFNYYLGTFLTSTINQLTKGNFENMKIVFCPNAKEQEEIVKYLQDQTDRIDKLIKNKQQKIEKLQDYKKSLIYEYVTGKKQVND